MTGVWVAADTISAARMNEKTIFQGTGAAISGLATTYAGMLAFCTSTGSGFTADKQYVRNAANSSWTVVSAIVTLTSAANSITQNITSTSFVDVTALTVTLPATGTSIITFNIVSDNTTVGGLVSFVVVDNGSATNVMTAYQQPVASKLVSTSLTYTTTAASQIVKLQAKVDSGSVDVLYSATYGITSVRAFTVE